MWIMKKKQKTQKYVIMILIKAALTNFVQQGAEKLMYRT